MGKNIITNDLMQILTVIWNLNSEKYNAVPSAYVSYQNKCKSLQKQNCELLLISWHFASY